mmetsp:Transcript_24885/g.65323  ORF Transcript_24885/g.65323 Transcript_24885/m.65323 type:complete len:119 (+) Transcript_24885:72-428(+)
MHGFVRWFAEELAGFAGRREPFDGVIACAVQGGVGVEWLGLELNLALRAHGQREVQMRQNWRARDDERENHRKAISTPWCFVMFPSVPNSLGSAVNQQRLEWLLWTATTRIREITQIV